MNQSDSMLTLLNAIYRSNYMASTSASAVAAKSAYLAHQSERLIELGYPEIFGLHASKFHLALETLANYIPTSEYTAGDAENGYLPFVLVINSPAIPVSTALPLIRRRGKSAIERLYPMKPDQFAPIKGIEIPTGEAYLLLDVDRGKETLNVTPDAALQTINNLGRSPLTIEEGVALLTQFPEFLQPNNCFSLLASRCGDQRVPALWLSEARPKLGWCWAGNPHTWLGSASCARRSPAVALSVATDVR
jgi:Family of unknown function (DUF5701)